MKKLLAMVAIGLIAVSYSCNPTAIETPDPSGVSVINGRLQFRDLDHLTEVVLRLEQTQTKADLYAWEKKFAGFTSMRTAFNRLTSSEKDIETIGKNQSTLGYEDILRLDPSGDDLEASRLIDSEILATVFDASGVVRFGKDAYKYALDKVYIIRNFEEANLQGLGSIQEIVHLKRTTAHSKNARLADVSNECINNYRHGGYLKRLVADYTLNQP